MADIVKAVDAIFTYPHEYIFIPRGSTVLNVSRMAIPPHLKTQADAILDKFPRWAETIDIRYIGEPPLEFAAKLGRKSPFCVFNPKHREVASQLITMLMEVPDAADFVALAVYIRDRLNPYLFQYAFSVAVQHRKDLAKLNIKIPSVVTQFPGNFIEPSILQDVRKEIKFLPPSKKRPSWPDFSQQKEEQCPPVDSKIVYEVPLNYTASDREKEQRMAYFREDIGVNMHHWHWHLVYPNTGSIEVIRKDRRGELFMYMHNQIIARYNLDRFCNDLNKTTPLGDLRAPIPEAYYPKILETVSNRTYPARMPGQRLQDMNRIDLVRSVSDLERWANRIAGSIDRGYVLTPQEERVPLDEKQGIDLLGNLIESSGLSINQQFYGDLHNQGHLIIAYIHDPDDKYLERPGVMGDITTAMRDPIFYRWHTYIDNFGKMHKALLPPYGSSQLGNEDIVIEQLGAKCVSRDSQPNVMRTFWEKSDVEIGVDLSFNRQLEDGYATFRFTHLQHEPFVYDIMVTNLKKTTYKGTCRIFLLPSDRELMEGLTLDEQRLLAVELDRFPVILTPGPNRIRRSSTDSSVTTSFTNIFKPRPKELGVPLSECLEDLCSCGWPSHMLLPKGTAAGKMFKLFVMVSDDFYPGDWGLTKEQVPSVDEKVSGAYSFCGLRDKAYPDTRSMGFPFDRRLPAYELDQLVKNYGNMKTCDLNIVFNETIENCKTDPKA